MKSQLSNLELSVFADRAKGAMFLIVFGAAWLTTWSQLAFPGNLLSCFFIAIVGLSLFALALNRYSRFRIYAGIEVTSPAKKKMARRFHIINAAQWITILVAANVLINLGLPDWIIPMAVLVVGLHFLPLAKLYSAKGYLWLGIVISLFAVTYPFILSGGPADPYGCLGMGLMLWFYALGRLLLSFRVSLGSFKAQESCI